MRCAVWAARGLAACSLMRWSASSHRNISRFGQCSTRFPSTSRHTSFTGRVEDGYRRRAPPRWGGAPRVGCALTWCAQKRGARGGGGHWRAALARDDQLHHGLVQLRWTREGGVTVTGQPSPPHHPHPFNGRAGRGCGGSLESSEVCPAELPFPGGGSATMNLFRFAGGFRAPLPRTSPLPCTRPRR